MKQSHSIDARNGLIGKIHVAKKKLALQDDSYRAILLRVGGAESCKDMTVKQLEAVLEEFKRFGFKATAKRRAGPRKMADGAEVSKIRALWLDLYHLGELRDSSEEALAHFASRCTKVRALQWLTSAQVDIVIKALRGWLERIGYKHPTAETVIHLRDWRLRNRIDALDDELNYHAIAAKISLIHRQMAILDIPDVVEGITVGPEYTPAQYLDGAIESYGRAVRKKKEVTA